jgi:polyhydroxyalkanoate synthesis regulator phasin
MHEAWRAYLELALGVTEASRKKAQKVAQKLVGKGGATAAQLQALTEEVLTAGSANREAMTKLVRTEVERALGRIGLVSSEEVAGLTARVQELEAELREARARAAAAEADGPAVGTTAPAGDAVARNTEKAVAKKAVAKKAVAKKAVANKAAATPSAAGDMAALPTPGSGQPAAGGGQPETAPAAPVKAARKTAKKAVRKAVP